MLIKIQILNRWDDSVIFEHEEENNTIAKTLIRANLSGADLRRADLSDADLRRADLSGANLSGADLRRAYLSDADLRRADLSGANLSGADLRRTDLSGADLSGADLPIYCKWSVRIKDDKIAIGCKVKSIEEWDKWFDGEETFDTARGSVDFKRIYANYVAVREYYKIMNADEIDGKGN